MKYIFTLFFLLFHVNIFSQTVSLEWVKTFGAQSSSSDVSGKKTLVDLQGNLFVIGEFSNTVDFDPGLNIFNLVSNGDKDIYIQKLDSNGNFLWAKSIGGIDREISADAANDSLGNIIIVGDFSNSVDFDPGFGIATKTSNGQKDFFVLKLDNAGNYLWAHSFGSSNVDVVRKLCLSNSNEIIAGGYFHNTIDFDPNTSIYNRTAISYDIYLLKLDASGNFIWVKTLEGSNSANGDLRGLTSDQNQNFYLGGVFKDTVDFDPGIALNLQFSLVLNAYSFFILKLNSDGQFEWVRITNIPSCNTMTTDHFGHLFLGGTFFGTVDFDPGLNVYNAYSAGFAAYALKLDTSGNFKWMKKIGGMNGPGKVDIIYDIKCNNYGDISLCGEFAGLEDFNPNIGVYLLGPGSLFNSSDAFYMQLDSAGNFNWAAAIGDSMTEATANCLSYTPQGKIYVVGQFDGTTDFDPTAGIQTISSGGGYHAYILKLKLCMPNGSVDIIDTCSAITWIDGTIYSASNFSAKDTLINSSGCDSIVTLNLTITSMNTNVVVNSHTLVSDATGVFYQWMNCDPLIQTIVGATNQSYQPNANGSFAVIISNGNCIDTSGCIPFLVSSIGDEEMADLVIKPNPTKDKISILLAEFEDEILIEVFNLEGRIIQTEKLQVVKELKINLDKYSDGLYFIKLKTNKWQQILKVTKE